MKWWDRLPWSWFFECLTLSQIFHCPLSLSSRGLLVPLHCHKGGVICMSEVPDISPGKFDSSLCFILLSILHYVLCIWVRWSGWQYTALAYSFCMMYSAYELNDQGDNIQPWHTPFLIWNQSVFPCPVLAVASWPAYGFLRRQAKWFGIPISLRIFHSLSWSTQSQILA